MIKRTIDVGNYTLEVLESDGEGEPLFLFHGNSSAANSFQDLLDSDLGRTKKLIAVSFPGHGESSNIEPGVDAFSIEEMGKIAVDVVSAFGYSNYWLLGQSLGGHAILEALEHFPGVKGVVLVSAPPLSQNTLGEIFKPDPSDGRLFKGMLDENEVDLLASCFIKKSKPEYVDLVKTNIRKTDPRFRPALGKGIHGGHLKDEYKAIMDSNCPVALLAGTEDEFLHSQFYEKLPMNRFWNNKVVWFDDCGHAVNFENPVLFERTVSDFISSI